MLGAGSLTLRIALPLVTLLAFAGLAAAACGDVHAWGAGPARLDFGGVLPEVETTRVARVTNNANASYEVEVNVTGDAAPWVRLGVPHAFPIGPCEARDVPVTIDVPAGEPPGAHELRLRFVRKDPSPPNGSALAAALEVSVRAHLNVTHERRAVAHVTGIDVEEADVAGPLRATVRAASDGNAPVPVRFSISVRDARGALAFATEVDAGDVPPGEARDFALRLPHELEPGRYAFEATAVPEGGPPFARQGVLEVLDAAARARRGLLESLRVLDPETGEDVVFVRAGADVRLVARFRNVGTETLPARFFAQVQRDGKEVNALGTRAVEVAPGETVNLSSLLLAPREGGRYEIVGRVHYHDRATEPRGILLNVEGPLGTSDGPRFETSAEERPGASTPLASWLALAAGAAGARALKRLSRP